MRRLVSLIIIGLLLATSSNASFLLHGGATAQTIIYVATTGNDSNSGTFASPYLTVGKAQTAAQSALSAHQCPIIYFRSGTYPVASTLNFGSTDSGSVSCTVSWSSYPSENAIWSGGTVLTGTFSLCTTADAVCNSGAGGVYQSSTVLMFMVGGANSSNNTATNNWTTKAATLVQGTNNSVSGTVLYTSGSPPAGAAAVIANAGIQAGVTPGP